MLFCYRLSRRSIPADQPKAGPCFQLNSYELAYVPISLNKQNMMNSNLLKSPRLHQMALALAACVPMLAHAGGAQPEGVVCFYEHVNYQGASFCASADSNWIGSAWNDRVSSAKVRDGASVDMYLDINYSGKKITLTGDNPNFVALGFNDALSSYRVQDAKPVALSSVELAQTHVIAPTGRAMQAPNDAKNGISKHLELIADRPALLMVQPTSQVTGLQVRARLADGSVLGPLPMNAPGQLPATDAGRAPYSTVKYSLLLPKEWVKIGSSLEFAQSTSFNAPVSVPLTVTPPINLKAYTMPVYLFGARASRSAIPDFSLHSRNTAGYTLDQEYQQKLPITTLEQVVAGAITMDQVTVPARNDAQFCYPAMSVGSLGDFQAIQGDFNARILRTIADIHGTTANRDGDYTAGYYGFMQYQDGANQVVANTGGGLGGGGSGVSGGDYRPDNIYAAIFNHEMGHAYGLAHADSAAETGDYPYTLGTKSGSSWGYDANKNTLLSTLQVPGQSCDGRTVNNVCYERTPMSGGDDDRDASVFRWDAFSDYQAAQMQEGFLSKLVPDSSFDGGYKRWNSTTNSFEAMPADQRARSGSDVVKQNQSVQTIIGSISHFNLSPSASRMFVTPAWTGNLPKQLDPTVQSDLDLINSSAPGGSQGYFCLYNGCDYTVVASYNDGTSVRVLLPIGYHQFGYPTSNAVVRPSAQNIMDGDNFATYAVNVPAGHGGLSRVQLFNTAFGSKWQDHFTAISAAALGTSSYPLVNQWTPNDGSTGGAGAPGNSQFNAGVCQAGAVIKYPK